MKNVLLARRRGSVLPVVLSMSIGVGALAAGYTSMVVREHSRERWERDKQQAYLDAWAQMEVVAAMVKASGYSVTGSNLAVEQALLRADRTFVDRDGWLTHVELNEIGGAGSGYYEMVSTAQVEDAVASVSSLMRERASFSDYVYFVDRHNLGIAGGQVASWPYTDAPEGNIHTNKSLLFYFADRHFKDPVSATLGFQYMAGASAANQYFHGPNNDAAPAVTGLMDVQPEDLGLRSDTLLNLNGPYDSARVRLLGDVVNVEHWIDAHTEVQPVAQQVPVYVNQIQQQEIFQTVTINSTYQQANWAQRSVWNNVPYQQTNVITPGYWAMVPTSVRVAPFQVWVENTGGSGSGGAIGGGSSGYWQAVYNYQTQNINTWFAPVTQTVWVDSWAWRNEWYIASYTTVPYSYTQQQSYSPQRYQDVTVSVLDHYDTVYVNQTVSVPATLAATYNLASSGTMYATNDITFPNIANSTGYMNSGIQILDGQFTFSAGDDINIQETIVYGKATGVGVNYEKPYLNGNDRTQEYAKNPNYSDNSVLGLVAGDDILLTSSMPNQAEVNATMLASEGEVRVSGVNVASDGTVTATGGGYVKESYRSLGGVISAQRPVTTFVNSTNQVTRGFTYSKSVYDVKQRTNPPRGFPTLNRPSLMASIVKEVN